MKYVDLTHTFVDDMPVFPGDPKTSLKQITSIEKDGYTDHALTTMMHVGTHMDAPLHMIEGGKYMDEISPDRFAGPGVLLDARGKSAIDVNVLQGKILPPRSIVLVLTGMDDAYKTPAYENEYPAFTAAFARALVDAGVLIVGIDYINPDKEETYPVHKILLSRETLIIENLTNLDVLVGIPQFDVFAFPMKLHADAAPVRVIARIP